MSTPRRRSKAVSAPLSIRFTDDEKAILQRKAGTLPLGTYIKQVVLGADAKPSRARHPVKDGEALGQLLGLLGKSRIANNLNQLAKAANLGALPVLKETEDDLREACAAVLQMRQLLLAALGAEILGQVIDAPSLAATFERHAAPVRP